MLTAIETTATVGANRQLVLDEDLPTNISEKDRVIVLFAADDLSETEWLSVASGNDVFAFLNDEAEDIYTIKDGKPLDE